jgi:hypothetical protein
VYTQRSDGRKPMTMRPLALFDDELATIFDACRPLEPQARAAFLVDLDRSLRRLPAEEIGPGSVHRAVAALLPIYWSACAPDLSRRNDASKWR